MRVRLTVKKMAAETIGAPPGQGNCFNRACQARAVLSHLSSRWGLLVLAALHAETTLRFSELRGRLDGVSEKVLAQKLRELERDGLIDRRAYPVIPPRVEYRLTSLGIGVAEHVKTLVGWIETHVADLTTAQTRYDGA